MKYIKTYESSLSTYRVDEDDDIDRYWLIPTDDRLEDSLNKIRDEFVPNNKHILKGFLLFKDMILRNMAIKEYDKYIFVGNYEPSSWGWGWNSYEGVEECEDFNPNSIYFGRININENELEASKYNL